MFPRRWLVGSPSRVSVARVILVAFHIARENPALTVGSPAGGAPVGPARARGTIAVLTACGFGVGADESHERSASQQAALAALGIIAIAVTQAGGWHAGARLEAARASRQACLVTAAGRIGLARIVHAMRCALGPAASGNLLRVDAVSGAWPLATVRVRAAGGDDLTHPIGMRGGTAPWLVEVGGRDGADRETGERRGSTIRTVRARQRDIAVPEEKVPATACPARAGAARSTGGAATCPPGGRATCSARDAAACSIGRVFGGLAGTSSERQQEQARDKTGCASHGVPFAQEEETEWRA